MNPPRPDSKDPLVFLCPSDSSIEEYRVDLGSWNGIGECSCDDFQFRKLVKIKEGTKGEEVRCKHIKRARRSLADDVIARLIETRPREKDE